MKDYRLIVVVNAAVGQSVISEVTEAEGDCCRSSKDQIARRRK